MKTLRKSDDTATSVIISKLCMHACTSMQYYLPLNASKKETRLGECDGAHFEGRALTGKRMSTGCTVPYYCQKHALLSCREKLPPNLVSLSRWQAAFAANSHSHTLM